MNLTERNSELREASGTITYTDPLTAFFYLLLRNELAAGKVEALVSEAVNSAEECTFTNGWLAQYANNLAERIKNAKVEHLKKALDQVFTFEEEAKKAKAKEEEVKRIQKELEKVSESLDDEELAKLEQKLIAAATVQDEEEDVEEKPTVDTAKEAIQQLVSQGHLSEEDAVNLESDINEAIKRPEAVEVEPEEEGEKLTAEEAREMVESAVEESEQVKKIGEWLQTAEIDGYGVVLGKLPMGNADVEVIKNGEVASNAEWCKEHVTVIDENDDKWKNTSEELQKIEKEEKQSDEE